MEIEKIIDISWLSFFSMAISGIVVLLYRLNKRLEEQRKKYNKLADVLNAHFYDHARSDAARLSKLVALTPEEEQRLKKATDFMEYFKSLYSIDQEDSI